MHIKRVTLRDEVSDYLKKEILTGRLKAGERIVETKIAQELGVSQSPVREAIRELELMGLLESKPYVGSYAKKLSAKDINDAFKVRACLEVLACKEAVHKISEDQLKKMDTILEEMRVAAEMQNIELFTDLDNNFHRAIIDASEIGMINIMWNMVDLAKWTYISAVVSKSSLHEIVDDHRRLYDAMEKKDEEALIQQMTSHLDGFRQELNDYYEDKNK